MLTGIENSDANTSLLAVGELQYSSGVELSVFLCQKFAPPESRGACSVGVIFPAWLPQQLFAL